MAVELIVIRPFAAYHVGDLITDPATVAAILGNPEVEPDTYQFNGATGSSGGGTVTGSSGATGPATLPQVATAEAADASAIASLQAQLASGSAPTAAATVRGTYTASGALALTDDVSEVIATGPVTMTLAAGTTNNRLHVVTQAGPGAVTLQAGIDGTSQSVSLNAIGPLRDSLTLRWLADLSTYSAE